MKSRSGKPSFGRVGAFAAAFSLLALPTSTPADQNDSRLSPLFEVLQSATTPERIGFAERFIWMIWHESGRKDVDRLMETGIAEMGGGRLGESIETFGQVIDLAPDFAEGWNKRATAYYLAGELDASIRDVERTLALEPRHFGALSGLGLIYLAKGDDHGALRAFEATLEVHPRAPAARFHVQRLRAKLQVRTT